MYINFDHASVTTGVGCLGVSSKSIVAYIGAENHTSVATGAMVSH